MNICCPLCRSLDLIQQRRAEQIAGVLGLLTGAAIGVSSAFSRLGGNATTDSTPRPFAIFSEATAKAFTGAVAGYTSGVKAGRMVDHSAIGDLKCNYCGYVFFDMYPLA